MDRDIDKIAQAVPVGVKIIISHLGVNYEIIRGVENIDTVKVESIPNA